MMSPQSRITVLDVWQLALPSGTVVLGGREGLSHPVEWVASLRVSFPLFGQLDRGYIALARLDLARRLDPRITPAYLLQELHRARAAALVVDSRISTEDTALADQLALPVLLLPEGEQSPAGPAPSRDLHEIERAILRTLVDREAQLSRREAEARQQLQRTFSRGGMEAVLAELARLTGSAVSVYDLGHRRLGQAGVSTDSEGAAATTISIAVGGQALGMLTLHRGSAAPDTLDLVYARQAAEICGIEILQRRTREQAEEELGADLVELLLDETQQDDAIVARFARLGYSLTRGARHVVVALGPASAADATACEHLARDLEWSSQRGQVTVIVKAYRCHLLAFCALSATTSEGWVRSWLQDTIRSHSQCAAGISRVVMDVVGLRAAVSQAIDAGSLGQHIVGRASPYFYDELGLYRLLTGMRAHGELDRFYDETLGALLRYDATHGTDLVHTLQVFFEQNANASQTSRALFVHRNTLNYRLQRIMEISGLDPDDAEARLAFQLALKVHRLSTLVA